MVSQKTSTKDSTCVFGSSKFIAAFSKTSELLTPQLAIREIARSVGLLHSQHTGFLLLVCLFNCVYSIITSLQLHAKAQTSVKTGEEILMSTGVVPLLAR